MKHCKWLFVFGLLAAPQAFAQVFMKATLEDASSAVLRLQIGTLSMASGVVGFDIYRHDAWRPEVETLLTPTAVPSQAGTYEIVDTGIQSDHLYLYEVRSVDATRKLIAVDWTDFLSVGRALVAEAKLVQGACDLYLESCPAASFRNGTAVQGVAACMVGEGQFYRMYGRIVGPPTPLSTDSITYVDELVPMACSPIVAVAPSTWGGVKALFH